MYLRLIADVLLLESYRTSLLQLKPIWTPAYIINAIVPSFTSDDEQLSSSSHKQNLVTADACFPQGTSTLNNLAIISILSWQASGQWSGNSFEAEGRHWDPYVFQLAVDRIVQNPSVQADPSTRLLAHMTILALYAPLVDITDLAYSISTRKAPTTPVNQCVRRWSSSSDVGIALEHSAQIIEIAYNSTTETSSANAQRSGHEVAFVGAPHDAHCVFNAALVTWITNQPSFARNTHSFRVAPSALKKACWVLMQLPIAAARAFVQMIEELDGPDD